MNRAGAAPSSASHDPIQGMLLFHRSIRAALQALDDVAALAERGESDVLRAAALYEFFTGPMRWHDTDERESLLRRLADREPARFDEALRAALDDHGALTGVVDGVLLHLEDVARRSTPPDARRLRTAAHELRAVVEPHIEREEREVFPRARALLSAGELAEISREIDARRLRRLSVASREGHEHARAGRREEPE